MSAAQRAVERRAALPVKRKGRFLRKYFKNRLTCNIFVIYNKHEQKRRAIDFRRAAEACGRPSSAESAFFFYSGEVEKLHEAPSRRLFLFRMHFGKN